MRYDFSAARSGDSEVETMISRRGLLAGVGAVALIAGWRWMQGSGEAATAAGPFEVEKPDADWRALLTAAQYDVLRQHGTERPFSSPLDHEKRKGTFACAGCGLDLFSSATKFDSGTGWPSFWQPMKNAVGTTIDLTLGMRREAVHCHRCG